MPEVTIKVTHHIDAGEQDADGYYEYDIVEFSLDGAAIPAGSSRPPEAGP